MMKVSRSISVSRPIFCSLGLDRVLMVSVWSRVFKIDLETGHIFIFLLQHGLGSKSTCAFLLFSWEKHFMALSPAWWSWQAFQNFNHISIKSQADSNILASPEAGRGNCLPYVLAPLLFSCESGE